MTKTMITIITIIIIIMMMMMKITTGDAHLAERLAHTWTLVLELAPMSLSLFLCLRSKSLHDDDQRDGDYEQNPLHQLDTEMVFWIPFDYAVSHQVGRRLSPPSMFSHHHLRDG